MIKRYVPYGTGSMDMDEDGGWVKYEDHRSELYAFARRVAGLWLQESFIAWQHKRSLDEIITAVSAEFDSQ